MSTTPKRERWTNGKQDQLYEKYFTPLLTEWSFDYLQALYEQTQYERHYREAYTATETKRIYHNRSQQLTAATTQVSVTSSQTYRPKVSETNK